MDVIYGSQVDAWLDSSSLRRVWLARLIYSWCYLHVAYTIDSRARQTISVIVHCIFTILHANSTDNRRHYYCDHTERRHNHETTQKVSGRTFIKTYTEVESADNGFTSAEPATRLSHSAIGSVGPSSMQYALMQWSEHGVLSVELVIIFLPLSLNWMKMPRLLSAL